MAYNVSFGADSSWNSGFTGTISISNISPDPLNGWVIEFDAPFEVTNLWNGQIVSHVGSHYVVRDASWNATIPPNGIVSFGFQASNTGTVVQPTGYTVNGQVVGGEPAPSIPAMAVSDISLTEGGSGSKGAVFTVSLSKASTEPVSVSFASTDGTAKAGSDYVATSGTLTFAPGETTKSVDVSVLGDMFSEANETFQFNLSNASGASVSKAQAVGTILNDDQATPLPTITIADIAVQEGNPVLGGGTGAGTGFFHTEGNQIVDEAGQNVRIAGVNWFGMESNRYAPDGLHARNYKEMMNQMADLGFNTIRLPFSDQLFDAGSMPNGVDFSKNPDLASLTGLQIMDKIVAYAGQIGMKVILDHHRSSAGAGANENGLWYGSAYSEQKWIDNWTMLASRYAGNSTVIGADLHNEPHGSATWGGGGATDWAAAAERSGNAVLRANSNWLIFVEGVESYNGEYYWWGGNLMGVKDRPIRLDSPGHLVYSAHDYPNSIFGQPWFNDPAFPTNLPAKFDQMWGYIHKQGIAPVYLGEFGSRLTDSKDVAWLDKIQAYLSGDFDANGTSDIAPGDQGIHWTWWSWNPNSGDTGGILLDDWTTVHQNKIAELEPLMFDFETGGSTPVNGTTDAVFTVELSAASTTPVMVAYKTVAGTADGSDFTPVSGTLTFAPGETRKTVTVKVAGDAHPEADESFQFMLSSPSGATLAKTEVTASIVNDDGGTTTPTPPTNPTTPTTPSQPSSGAQLEATTMVTSDWGSGFTANVSVMNTGTTSIDGWMLQLHSTIDISNIWSATIVSHTGDTYVVHNSDWNGTIAPGQEVTFGFKASPGQVPVSSIDWVL
jgi:endoglucanase